MTFVSSHWFFYFCDINWKNLYFWCLIHNLCLILPLECSFLQAAEVMVTSANKLNNKAQEGMHYSVDSIISKYYRATARGPDHQSAGMIYDASNPTPHMSGRNIYVILILGKNAAIWYNFLNICQSHFWGHWGQRMFDVEVCLNFEVTTSKFFNHFWKLGCQPQKFWLWDLSFLHYLQ